jgi:hypothetical protein
MAATMMMGEDDDDDPVVAELPVYLATRLATQLHVLQFPLRPAARPYDHGHGNAPLAAAFKPQARGVPHPSPRARLMHGRSHVRPCPRRSGWS